MVKFVQQLSIPKAFYVVAHSYFPMKLENGQLHIVEPQDKQGRDGSKYFGGEMQMTLQPIRWMCNLARQYYDANAKRIGSLRLDTGLIETIHRKVLGRLKNL
jgi:hypothetical protein